MTTIRKIFKADLYGLFHNFFALVIAVGLCILPALYAWFNIYANWDPYANTGNIRIAVANLDEGCTDLDGEDANMGQEIVEQLKQKDNIGWVFVDSKKDAVDRVKSGDCYAAVVIDPEFSYGLYNALMDNISQPKITYYENEKKNAVATKITDTAVSTLQSTINQSFVKVVTEKIFTQTNDLQASLKDDNAVDAFIEKLETVQGYLKDYDKMITSFLAGNELVTKSADDTNKNLAAGQEMIQSGIDSMEDGKQNLKTSKTSFATFSKEVTQALNKIQQTINTIDTHISAANLDKQIDTLAKDVTIIQEDAKDLSVQLQSLSDYLKTVQGDSKSLENTIDTVNKLQTMADNIADIPGVDENASDAKKTISAMQRTLKNYSDTIENINTLFAQQISPQVQGMLDDMADVLESTEGLLQNLSGTLDGMKDIFDGVDTTLGTLNTSLTQLQEVLEQTSEKIGTTLDKLKDASDSEQMDIIMNLLAGDPDTYGDFFSQPVKVNEHYMYEIANYGSGVAPFYTVLAIWVGMTILVSLLKVHVDKKDFPKAKPYQYFFGRYLLFLLLSEIQAMVIVAGDLYIFGVQCKHLGAMFLTAAVTSFTFSMLIYALTISFGDIGKALAVVIMVLQIAGSGGTYPIEALPRFFRSVYIFFPFPYAINGMRECIGGMYHQDLTVDLLKLLIFAVAGLFIGLVVRIPFIGLNHFIEKRMEDTKML